MVELKHVEYDPFELGEVDVAFRSTAPQKEIWVGASMGGSDANRAFNECLVLRLNGGLDREALRDAYNALVLRHESLRASFSAYGEWCLIARSPSKALSDVDLRAANEVEQRVMVDELRLVEVKTPFDLTCGPLHRAKLIALGETRHQLLFSAHHIVCDWWSAGVLMQDLGSLYRQKCGAALDLAPAPSFAEYARQRSDGPSTEEGQRDLAYWLEALASYVPSWRLPAERASPVQRSYASRRLDIEWEPDVSRAVRALGRRHRCTLTTACLSLLQAWLFAKAGANDVVIGVPSSGQVAHGQYRLVGHCVHLLPVRLQCHSCETFEQLASGAKRSMVQCLEHQQLTYSTLLEHLPHVRKDGQLPLVSICLNVDKGLPLLDFGSLDVSCETVPRRFETFELSLNVVVSPSRIVVQCNYNVGLFLESSVRSWVAELGVLALCASQNDSIRLNELVQILHA